MFGACRIRSGVSLVKPRRTRGLITRKFERKRFYKEVTVIEDETPGSYLVKLDHRNLRTPLGRKLVIPSKALALAVAQEWQCQGDDIKRELMNLTTVINTILDEKSSSHISIEELLGYVNSDTLCFRETEPEDLVARQSRDWDPLIEWFNERFSCDLTPKTSLLPISPSLASDHLRTFITTLNRWALAGLELAVDSTKSLVLSCALFEGRIDTQQACDLSRLETVYQTEKWGEVEWHHLVEEKDLKSRLGAAVLLKDLTI